MDIKEKRDIQKLVKFDIETKDIRLYYKVVTEVEFNGVKIIIQTDNEMSFNLINEDLGYYENGILQMEQDVVTENEKKVVQFTKNLRTLEELGYTNIKFC